MNDERTPQRNIGERGNHGRCTHRDTVHLTSHSVTSHVYVMILKLLARLCCFCSTSLPKARPAGVGYFFFSYMRTGTTPISAYSLFSFRFSSPARPMHRSAFYCASFFNFTFFCPLSNSLSQAFPFLYSPRVRNHSWTTGFCFRAVHAGGFALSAASKYT